MLNDDYGYIISCRAVGVEPVTIWDDGYRTMQVDVLADEFEGVVGDPVPRDRFIHGLEEGRFV